MKEDSHHALLKELLKVENISKIEINSDVVEAVELILKELDEGKISIAEKLNGDWKVHQHFKLAILLSFRMRKNFLMNDFENFHSIAFDKFPSKFQNWTKSDFENKNIRVLPNCCVRYSAFIDKNVILTPSFINVGAYVGENTMIDTWATVGSCAYIGKNVHISGGVGIGGVLEPLQANPTIIEDGCFIGARSEICEGVIIGEGSVVSMGCYIGQSTKIINRETGETFCGRVPPYSVIVPGNYRYSQNTDLSGYCVILIKQVDKKTREKTSINELLR